MNTINIKKLNQNMEIQKINMQYAFYVHCTQIDKVKKIKHAPNPNYMPLGAKAAIPT